MRARRSTARRGREHRPRAGGAPRRAGRAGRRAGRARGWCARATGAILHGVTHRGLRGRILRILAEVAPDADTAGLRPDVAFRDQIEIDSLDFLNFVLALEKRLRIRIPEADYPKLATLDGCVAYLRPRHPPR
jgi:acyl carrier protein